MVADRNAPSIVRVGGQCPIYDRASAFCCSADRNLTVVQDIRCRTLGTHPTDFRFYPDLTKSD